MPRQTMKIGVPTNFKYVEGYSEWDKQKGETRRQSAPAISHGALACAKCNTRSNALESCHFCNTKYCSTCIGDTGACADCKLFEDIMNKPMKKKKDVISSIVGLFKPGDAKIKPVASTPQKLERQSSTTPGSALKNLFRRGSSTMTIKQPDFEESGQEGKIHEELDRLRKLTEELEKANEELTNALMNGIDLSLPKPVVVEKKPNMSNETMPPPPVPVQKSESENDELKAAKEHVVSLQVQIAQAKAEIMSLGEQLAYFQQQHSASSSSASASSLPPPPPSGGVQRSTVPVPPPIMGTPEGDDALLQIQSGTYVFATVTSASSNPAPIAAPVMVDGKMRSPIPQAPPLPGFSAPSALEANANQQPRRGSAPANLGGPLILKKQAAFAAIEKKKEEEMRPVYWTPIDAPKITGTIWEKMDAFPVQNSSLDKHLKELSKRFAKKVTVEKKETVAQVAAPARQKLLDPTRQQNIGIGLTGTFRGVNIATIRKGIVELDANFLQPEVIHKLLGLIPNAEEQKLIDDLTADGALDANFLGGLSKEENFTLEMSRIPKLRQRLQCLFTEICFEKTAQSLEETIEAYTKAIKTLKTSKNWRAFLHLCLETGNFMNEGSKRAGAWGFSVDSISKLAEAKAGDSSKYSLLHWIAEVCAATKPEVFKLEEEFVVLEETSGSSIEEIKAEFAQLKRQIDIVKREVDEAKLNAKMEGSEIFIKRMDGPFLQKIALPFVEKINQMLVALEKEGEELLVMHGEKVGGTTTQKMIGTVLNGVALFLQCHKENEINKISQMKAQKEESRKVAASLEGVAKKVEKEMTKDKVSKVLKDTGLSTGAGKEELEAAMAKRRNKGA